MVVVVPDASVIVSVVVVGRVVFVAPDTVVTTSISLVTNDTLSKSTLDIFSSTASIDGKETSADSST